MQPVTRYGVRLTYSRLASARAMLSGSLSPRLRRESSGTHLALPWACSMVSGGKRRGADGAETEAEVFASEHAANHLDASKALLPPLPPPPLDSGSRGAAAGRRSVAIAADPYDGPTDGAASWPEALGSFRCCCCCLISSCSALWTLRRGAASAPPNPSARPRCLLQ